MGDSLDEAARDLAQYLPMLEALLPQQPDTSQPKVTMTASTASSPPWSPGPANVLMSVHWGVRRLEDRLRTADNLPVRPRGGSDANTRRALAAIAVLGSAIPVRHQYRDNPREPCRCLHCDAIHELTRWANQARRLPGIDELPRWRPIRTTDGSLPPACPYCKTFSLRVAAMSGAVMCFYPGRQGQGCTDADGNRPYGRLDISRLDGTPVVAWNDGLTERAPEEEMTHGNT